MSIIKYETLSISNLEQEKSNYWNKILTIKKTSNPYTIPTDRVILDISITSYIASLYESFPTKTSHIKISHLLREKSDTRNTFIECDDVNDTKIKFFEDDECIYVYAQNYSLVYGNKLICEANISHGKSRCFFHDKAKFEELPTSKNEIFADIVPGYSYLYEQKGSSNWEDYYMPLKLKMENKYSYKFIEFDLFSNSSNSSYSQRVSLYLHSDENKNKLTVDNGTVYLKRYIEDGFIIFEVYTRLFGSGVRPTMTITKIKNINTNELIIDNKNNQYFSSLAIDEKFTKIEGMSLSNRSCVLPNGMKMEFGQASFVNEQKKQITYQSNFKRICNVQLTPQWGTTYGTVEIFASGTSSTTEFTIQLNTANTLTVNWLVVGY